jgi:pyrroloquinoline quinone (PQQ) biosynthesis protein C
MLQKIGVPLAALGSSALITNVRIEPGHERLAPALFYAAARRARIGGATTVLAPVRDLAAPDTAVLGLKATPHPRAADHVLAAQRLDLVMHRTWNAMAESGTTPELALLAAEVEETIQRWVAGGKEWSFFKALRERRLTREQYVYTVSNVYQFVRHTTRIIGRAISACADPDLRKHWIGHLQGEVNHEVIIERDLKHMGEDVDYVKNHMAPNRVTHEFMAIQESVIAYHNDPVLMMASPLAAEAVTAHLDEQFVDDLLHCAASWGIEEPKRACQFLISHMNTDGGEDGHWRMSIEALPKLIQSEARLAMFLTTNAASRRSIEGVFTAPVDDMAIWSA